MLKNCKLIKVLTIFIVGMLLSSIFVFAEKMNEEIYSDRSVTFIEFDNFDEFVRDYSNYNGLTVQRAYEFLNRFFADDLSRSSYSYGYFTRRIDITPTNSGQYPYLYRPTIRVYCKYVKDPVYSILEIVPGDYLQRTDGSVIKQFEGTVRCHLETPYIIHYGIDGQFYNQGITSCTVGYSNIVFYSISQRIGLYSDVYQTGDIVVR